MTKIWKYFLASSFLLFFILLFFTNRINAQTFPYNAKRINLDIHSGTSGTLLAPSSTPRTVLYSEISCDTATDNHIRSGTSGTDYLVDSENNRLIDIFNYEYIAPSTTIQWQKQVTGDHCNYSVIYTDYNLASTTPSFNCLNCAGGAATSTYGIIGSTTMITNIDNIGYTATTTIISQGVEVTQATYQLPFVLFKYVFSIIIMTIVVIALYLFFRNLKNAD